MIVNNKEMIHIHKNGLYDDLWKVGNELLIDDNYNSNMCNFNNACSGVKNKDGEIIPLYTYIRKFKEEINNEEKILRVKNLEKQEFIDKTKYLYYMLQDAEKMLYGLGIMNRENSLEEVRKEKYSNLPSRFHSIWVCDKESYEFWIDKLIKDSTTFKVLLNGELFKSSDSFLPLDGDNIFNQKIQAEKYWNPDFKNKEDEKGIEYLFQGKVKILGLYKNN